jgi:hypothetical protein
MPYTPRSRERFRSVVALLTGAAAFTTVAATGVVTGLAARQTGLRDQQRAQEQARLDTAPRAARPRTSRDVSVLPRPQRIVIHTTVVRRTSREGVAAVGAGGNVRSRPPGTSSVSGSGQSTGSLVRPAPAAPPPAPAPAPARSTGS